jgi:hypothetical protein
VIAAVKAWRTRNAAPHVEQAAVAHVGADWDALNKYWQAEIDRRDRALEAERAGWVEERVGYRRTIGKLRRQVDRLEAHIWLRLPPPPPPDATNETEE